MQETQVRSLGGANPLEEGMATHTSILAWKNPMNRGAWRATVHGIAEWKQLITHGYDKLLKDVVLFFFNI